MNNCPSCNKKFPWLVFRLSKKVSRSFSSVVFICNSCQKHIRAEPTKEYERNRIGLSIISTIGIPVAAITASFFSTGFQLFVGVTVYILLISLVSIRGHHLMRFVLEESEPE